MNAPFRSHSLGKSLVWVIALLAASLVSGARASDADDSNYLTETDRVPPAQQQAYETGMQKYNQCLSQNGFPLARTAWAHENGSLFSYTYLSGPSTWKGFDDVLAAEKACVSVKQSAVSPYLESEDRRFYTLAPELTHKSKEAMPAVAPFMEFKFFTIKSGIKPYTDFTGALAQFTTAEDKSTWPGQYMMFSSAEGADGDSDFMIIREYQSMADFGDKLGVFSDQYAAMLQHRLGKAKLAALLKQINDAIQNAYYNLASYRADLSIGHK